jgi:hypothetical protein
VVVVEEDQDNGLLLFQPFGHRLVAFEQRRPGRVVLALLVAGEADGWDMEPPDTAD